MRVHTNRWPVLLALLASLVSRPDASPVRAAPPKQLPPWALVEKAVADCFEALPRYQPGAIIVRSEAQGVLERLDRMGWRVADGKEILGLVPNDGDFLPAALRTPNGRAMMRQIAQYPDGYDRLDRLSRLPRGQRMVRDLIRGPGGYKLIEYMTTSPGGISLGSQLSQAPDGRGFNKPTGRIYTVEMLRERLRKSYEKASTAARGGASNGSK